MENKFNRNPKLPGMEKLPLQQKPKPMDILKYADTMTKLYGNKDVEIKSDAEYAKIRADAKAAYERKNLKAKAVEPTIEHSPIGTIKNFDRPRKRVDNWSLIKATAKSPGEIADIRQVVNEDYKKHGIKHIAPEDKKYLDKPNPSASPPDSSLLSKEITAMRDYFGMKDEDIF